MVTKAAMFPSDDSTYSFSRLTKEGKKLTYELEVMQQPERARACGAGAKSSADRRPVDPPPVVQMRIFESDPNDMNKTEVTFSYDANFFLFATLEFARPMAHGRGQGQPLCPVLTGAAVAGISYLDRPSPAGYFIFSDLSVRHEGRYRLKFNLYEEVKDSKDEDKDWVAPTAPEATRNSTQASAPRQYLHFRLEAKSKPFNVFSAKKFPGLEESTSLSRVVAEQGCRVRIRREVRMRRRETKPMEKYAYEDARVTPEIYPGTPASRARSASNPSIDGSYGYCGTTPQHHPAPVHDLGYAPQACQLPPPPAVGTPTPMSTAPPSQTHLTFGGVTDQYCAPPTQPPVSRGGVGYSANYVGYAHHRQMSNGSGYDGAAPVAPLSRYLTDSTPRPKSERSDFSRASLPPLASPLDTTAAATTTPSGYSSGYSSGPVDYTRAYQRPLDPPMLPTASSSVSTSPTPTSIPPTLAPDPPWPNPQAIGSGQGQSVYGPPAPRGPESYATEPILSKRAHDEVFDARHDQPLYNGQRPPEALDKDHPSYLDELNNPTMEYRRANGQVAFKDPTASARVR